MMRSESITKHSGVSPEPPREAFASDALSLKELKTIIEQSYFQKKEGELMTIAEQLRMEGHLEDARDSILDILEARFGIIPQYIVKELKGIDEIAVLRQLRKKAVVVEGLEEFKEMVRKAADLSSGVI
jgi:hypothetical protein